MAEFEAELAEQDGTDTTGAAEEKKQGGEEAWLNSDRDYQYEEVKRSTCRMLKNAMAYNKMSLVVGSCIQDLKTKQS